MTRPAAALMDEATDPRSAAGDVEAVRQAAREPLPEAVPGVERSGGDGPSEPPVVLPQRQHQPPVVMMIVLSTISLALGFGYVAWLIA